MFGTVARMRIKPGGDDWFTAQAEAMRTRQIPGWLSSTIFRDASDPQVAWLVVVFEDEASYRANAEDNLQNVEYERLRSALEGDPEWHDGEVMWHWPPGAVEGPPSH